MKKSGGNLAEQPVVFAFRSVVEASGDELPQRIMYAPAGVHTIYPEFQGKPIKLTVDVSKESVPLLNASLAHYAKTMPKQKPFVDADHREQEAYFWPTKFVWVEDGEAPGIYIEGEWSQAGRDAIVGRVYRAFSGAFGTDAEYPESDDNARVQIVAKGARGSEQKPARITFSGFPVGCLTNKPAFKQIEPIWARHSLTDEWRDFETEEALEAANKKESVKTGAEFVRAAGNNEPGHPFRGNQYTYGHGAMRAGASASRKGEAMAEHTGGKHLESTTESGAEHVIHIHHIQHKDVSAATKAAIEYYGAEYRGSVAKTGRGRVTFYEGESARGKDEIHHFVFTADKTRPKAMSGVFSSHKNRATGGSDREVVRAAGASANITGRPVVLIKASRVRIVRP